MAMFFLQVNEELLSNPTLALLAIVDRQAKIPLFRVFRKSVK